MTFQSSCRALAAGLTLALLPPFADAISPEQIFEQASPSIVVVDIFDAKGKSIGLGSGTVIGAGQVITSCHVAQKGNNLQVRQAGKSFRATLRYSDPDRDLCQLSVPDLQAPSVVLGAAKKLRVGQRVYAIGAPQGLELTLSEGLISSLRPYEGSQYIQTSAAISPGSSGGGLFDDQGRLIGITSFQVFEGQNLNFALPVDWIVELPKRAQGAPMPAKKSGLDWLHRVDALEDRKDWRALLKLSQQWLKSEPRSAAAWFYLGNAYGNLKQPNQAIQAFQKALRINPEDAFAWYNMGLAYSDINQYKQAIRAFREALRIHPYLAGAWNNLGLAYGNLKQYDQAIGALHEALHILPGYADAWYNLGAIYSRMVYVQRRRDKMREIYETLRKLDPVMAKEFFDAFIRAGELPR